MALRLIPLRGSSTRPTVRERVTLDGTDYLLELQWNARDAGWYLHLFTGAGDPVALGLKLVANARLGHRSRDPRMPPGMLAVVDVSGEGVDPGIDDLATDLSTGRVGLLYLDESDLPADGDASALLGVFGGGSGGGFDLGSPGEV